MKNINVKDKDELKMYICRCGALTITNDLAIPTCDTCDEIMTDFVEIITELYIYMNTLRNATTQ